MQNAAWLFALMFLAAGTSGCASLLKSRSEHPPCMDVGEWTTNLPAVDDAEFRMGIASRDDYPILVRTTEQREEPARILAFDPATGSLLWNRTLPGYSWPFLALITEVKGTIGIDLEKGEGEWGVVGLDAKTGNVLWESPSSYALEGDGVFFLDENGTVVARAPQGAVAWEWSPPLQERLVSIHHIGGAVFAETYENGTTLRRLSSREGQELWEARTVSRIEEWVDEGILVRSSTSLSLLTLENGTTRWSIPSVAATNAEITMVPGYLLLSQPDGQTTAIGLSSGEVAWQRSFEPARLKDREGGTAAPTFHSTPFGIFVESSDETRLARVGTDSGAGTVITLVDSTSGRTKWTMNVVDGSEFATSPELSILYARGISGLSRTGDVRWHCSIPSDASIGLAGDARFLVTKDRIARVRE